MEIFRKLDYFKHLNDEQLASIIAKTTQKDYTKGSMLFFEGETPRSLIFLTEGQLKVYKSDPKGNEIILRRFKPYAPIAEIAVLEESPYPASAEFETDGSVIFLDLESVKKAMEGDSELAFALMRSLSRKIKYLEEVIAMNIVLDSTARTAKYIVEHEEDFDQLKKNLIAQDLNMTPETFSRILKKFKALQLIGEKNHHLTILNKEGLCALYEG